MVAQSSTNMAISCLLPLGRNSPRSFSTDQVSSPSSPHLHRASLRKQTMSAVALIASLVQHKLSCGLPCQLFLVPMAWSAQNRISRDSSTGAGLVSVGTCRPVAVLLATRAVGPENSMTSCGEQTWATCRFCRSRLLVLARLEHISGMRPGAPMMPRLMP